MLRIALVLLVLVAAAWLLCWPVKDETWSTLIGWTTGPDPNSHAREISVGRPFRGLTLEHTWNQWQGTDKWDRQIAVEWLLADLGIVPGAPLAAWLAARIWRTKRRCDKGLCARCGYDLRGNVSGICPECGTPIPAKA